MMPKHQSSQIGPTTTGRGGRGGGRGRGRVHDRHSGTGREDTAKSVRQGWGGEDAKSEANMEEAAKADAVKEAEAAEAEAKAAAQRKEEEEEEKVVLVAVEVAVLFLLAGAPAGGSERGGIIKFV